MDERSRVLLSVALGAVAGGLVGFLYLTRRGRDVREQMEPALDSFVDEINWARATVEKARDAVAEGRRAFDDMMAAARAPEPASGEPAGIERPPAGVVQ
ncbi:MAG: YtxH domain-containing protein [Acidobacteria bacterium]|nr:YtxH domain-containing protein [Acidobacteriota bacterium]MXZ73024.1 YtxH domain-containing protein [Acidobacteriota bacterium]MYD71649.1 YtxH domain-containing protein [Acidobacteriota bacterium]MYJ04433.1 YtxH domain-containing protein [Acidobacteriota bacterium]